MGEKEVSGSLLARKHKPTQDRKSEHTKLKAKGPSLAVNFQAPAAISPLAGTAYLAGKEKKGPDTKQAVQATGGFSLASAERPLQHGRCMRQKVSKTCT